MISSYPHLKRWLAGGLTLVILIAVAAFATFSGSSNSAAPADVPKASSEESWTMFGGSPARNMVSPTGKNLPVEWTDDKGNVLPKVRKWAADLGSKAYGGPIIHGGKIFVGTNNQNPRDKKWIDAKTGKPIDLGIVMAFDQADGKFQWQLPFEKLLAGRVQDWPEEGICSTPVVEGDRIYFVSNRCEVVCASTDGAIQWKLDMIGKLGVFPHNIAACSPLIVGEHLWIVTANGVDEGHLNVPAPRAPSFIKVAKTDGSVAWQYNGPTIKLTEAPKGADTEAFFKRLVDRGDLIQHGQWSNPAYGIVDGQPQVVFPGGEGWIYSFDLDGKLLWRFDCNPKDAEYKLQGKGTRNDFIATPVIHDNKVYIGVGQDPEHEKGVGHFWCIDMRKRGDVSPDLVLDPAVFPPKTKPNPNSAMVWHYGGFTTKEDRKKLRKNYYFGRTMSTCAIKDDLLYIAELGGYLHCLDAKTGKVHWTHDAEAAVWSSPYWADNKVYLGTDAGDVWVFAHGKEKKVLGRNTMRGHVRATPVAVGNMLYVMTENKLYALTNQQ
jgi:outer membrane protein assembly factor BamB